ncbi:MAG TPA: hypothetical protein VKR53_19980 [Puia sp.]|nr:hypothetical protein [Puia sp.]
MTYFISGKILAIGLITSILIASCAKNGAQPVTSISGPEPAAAATFTDTIVFASSWISFTSGNSAQAGGEVESAGCSSCGLVNVPDLGANVTNGGRVLVYVKFANIDGSIEILPTGSIGLTVESNLIEISTTHENFNIATFKYILIPSSVLAKTANLDFSDYYAVVAYYQLPE